MPPHIVGLTATEPRDLARFIEATGAPLLTAAKVVLVEGPAEAFLVPPLLKQVKGIDLAAAGVAVIPIFGLDFALYAKVVAATPARKCAILADTDQRASDALDDPATTPDLAALETTNLRVFTCKTSFERALAIEGNLEMLARAATDIGAALAAKPLRKAALQLEDPRLTEAARKEILKPLRQIVRDTARRYGKARFALLAARHVDQARAVPKYLTRMTDWLLG